MQTFAHDNRKLLSHKNRLLSELPTVVARLLLNRRSSTAFGIFSTTLMLRGELKHISIEPTSFVEKLLRS